MSITKFTVYTIKSHLKKLFIHYYIETFLSRDNFFWYSFSLSLFSSDILWYLFFPYSLFLFFSSSDLPLACSLNFSWSFHNNFLLYLVSRLCFFDNKSIQRSCSQWNFTHSFLYIIKKICRAPLLSAKL